MTEKSIPKISDAEWTVMEIIWDSKKITSQGTIERLSFTGWNENTVKTLITRLVKKGAAGYEVDSRDRRVYYYYPLIEKENCLKEETDSFLKKFYNGALTSLVSKFVEKDDISEDEIDKLIEILQEKKGKEVKR